MTRRKVFGYGGRFHVWMIARRLRKRGWPVSHEAAAKRATAADENGCRIVIDDKAECCYCETHHHPVLPGESDTAHLTRVHP